MRVASEARLECMLLTMCAVCCPYTLTRARPIAKWHVPQPQVLLITKSRPSVQGVL